MKTQSLLEQKNKMNRILFCTGITILFFILHAMIFHFHEAWRDESQAWVLVYNSSLREIIGLCASEGHPLLWFFILYPFTRLGFSFYHFSYISITAVSIAVWIWLYKAPFPLITKLCVVASPIFFYYNPIICRIYAVMVLLFVLIACLWKNRFGHPIWYGVLTAFLIQSHVLVCGAALGLIIDMFLDLEQEYAKERTVSKAKLTGILIPLVSLICFYLELRQGDGDEFFLTVTLTGMLRNFQLSHIRTVLGNFVTRFGKWEGLVLTTALIATVFYLLFKCAKNKALKSYLRELIVMICGFSWYWGIIVLVRSTDHIQMAIVFWMIVLFCFWIFSSKDEREKPFRYLHWALAIIGASSFLLCVYPDMLFDVRGPFSGSKEIAEQIIAAVPDHSAIILVNDEYCTSPYAYLTASEKQYYFWDIENAEEFSIHKWGRRKLRNLETDEVPEYAEQDFASDGRKRYFLTAEKMDAKYDGAVVCVNTKQNKWEENYWVYDLERIDAETIASP